MTDIQLAYQTMRARSARFQRLWDYYEARQALRYSAKRLAQVFRNIDARFRLDAMAVVVDSSADRIDLLRFDATNKDAAGRLNESAKAGGLFLDADDVHRAALVCGESFVIAWREPDEAPQVYFNDPRDTVLFDGLEDPRKPRFAAKRWVDADGKLRITLYYPDRLEYYASVADAAKMSPEKAQLNQLGSAPNPYGAIPVFRFRRIRRACIGEIENVLELQDAVDKLLSDMMVAAEFSSARQRWVLSNMEDASTLQSRGGAVWLIAKGGSDEEPTKVGEFQATDLNNFGDQIDRLLNQIAIITRTPRHYFNRQGGDPSGEALIAMESPLTRKVNRYIEQFSDTWSRVGSFLGRLSGIDVEPSDLTVAFAPIQTVQPLTQSQIRQTGVASGVPLANQLRDEGWTEDEIEALNADQVKDPTQAFLDSLEAMKRLGVPQSAILKRLGMTDDEIAQAKAESEQSEVRRAALFASGGAPTE